MCLQYHEQEHNDICKRKIRLLFATNYISFQGGERTVDEMCLHMFTYFPRMENLSVCLSVIYPVSWMSFLGIIT